MNPVERYLEKLAEYVIENPMGDTDPGQQFVMPQQEEDNDQIPGFINLSEQMVKRQNPNGAYFDMNSNEGADLSGADAEGDFYTGPSEPDNGMAME